MNNIFQKNILAIAQHNNSLAEIIRNTDYAQYIEVLQAKSGDVIPVVKKESGYSAVHSRFDPVKEAQRLIDEFDCAQYDCVIVSGFGFGYHIEWLLKKVKKDATVLILEQFPWMVAAAITHRDLQNILNDNRVILLVNPDEEAIAINMKGRSSYKTLFITHRGSFQINPKGYTNLQRIAKAYISTKEVNIATLAKFEKLWTSNIARNIREIISAPPAAAFFDKFTNIPAIIVNAGPTLTQSIPYIQKHYNNAVIVAVDTSLKVLEYYGIEPHFCITVDPQLINARYFEGVHNRRTVLIADPMVHPSTFLFYKGRKAITGVAFEMMKWLEQTIGSYGNLRYGGSVSTNAYDFAKRLGTHPIIMIGQDLAFTKGLAHVKGAYLDDHIFFRNYRTYTVEMFNRFQLTALPKIFVKGIKSRQVHTNQKMMIFISWFSRLNDPSLINATYDGAYIENVIHKNFDDIRYQNSGINILNTIDEIYTRSVPDEGTMALHSENLVEQLYQMLQQTSTMDAMLQQAIQFSEELIQNIKKRKTQSINLLVKKLDDIDKKLTELSVTKNLVGLTIQHIIHTVTEGYEIDETAAGEQEKVALKSLYLYKGMLEGVQYSTRVIKNMIVLLQQ
ncbi:MAG: 6-hydroxymethylpterin diphosphokinase MptE-like protein [Spirochaetota bacterium]